ncbi:MAG: response regulator transcription factor [bacterium]|nr:response regulator transcription factor [bacterium]
MNDKLKILLVEDDPQLGFVVQDGLEQNGYFVTHCLNGELAWEAFLTGVYSIVLLDVMMPIMDGISLTAKIREKDSHIPIIMLTAKGMQEDKIMGFNAGADDYLVKPFSIEELLLRIQVFLKRNKKSEVNVAQGLMKLGKYQFHYEHMELILGDKVMRLTRKEGELLRMLIAQQGKLIKRETLLVKIWGKDDYFYGRSMDVYISRIRKYLKEDTSIEISNYHGTGFMLLIKE